MAALFEGCGLTVETRRDLGRHSPYPHYLLRLRKSG